MEESSRDSYQKLGDPGDEENNNADKKVSKKCIIIIVVSIILVVLAVIGLIIYFVLSHTPDCPEGQYLPSDDDSKCYDCSSNCKKCEGTKTKSHCTVCKDGYSLDGDVCVNLFSFKGEYTTETDLETISLFNNAFIDNVEKMTVDGNSTDPASSYEFSKKGNHTVYFNLRSNNTVSDLSFLFSGIPQLNAMVFSEDFDSTNVTNINSMFYDCNNLTSVDLRHFITTNVEDMNDLFFSCNELNYVDISEFSTNISEVILFDGNLPENGSIILTTDFYEKIEGQFPGTWTVKNPDNDIYDLLEN